MQDARSGRGRRRLLEFAAELSFQRHGLARLGAHDALVVARGDSGVLRAHVAVERDQPALEVDRQQRHYRREHDQRHRQRQRQRAHHDEYAEDVGKAPDDIRKAPGDHAGDALRVAHHAREAVARARDAVIVEAQPLQVDEERIPEIPARVHLQAHAAGEVDAQHDKLRRHEREIFEDIAAKARQRTRQNKPVDDLRLDQRQQEIRHGEHEVAAHSAGDQPRMPFQHGPKGPPGDEGKSRFLLISHGPPPPSPPRRPAPVRFLRMRRRASSAPHGCRARRSVRPPAR